MFKKFLLVLALALLPTLSYAQTVCTADCSVPAGEPFTYAADHDGANTTSYRLYVDNVSSVGELPVASYLVNGVVTLSFTEGVLVPGTYVLQLAASGPNGEAKSTPITLTITPVVTPPTGPTAPTNPRIVRP